MRHRNPTGGLGCTQSKQQLQLIWTSRVGWWCIPEYLPAACLLPTHDARVGVHSNALGFKGFATQGAHSLAQGFSFACGGCHSRALGFRFAGSRAGALGAGVAVTCMPRASAIMLLDGAMQLNSNLAVALAAQHGTESETQRETEREKKSSGGSNLCLSHLPLQVLLLKQTTDVFLTPL